MKVKQPFLLGGEYLRRRNNKLVCHYYLKNISTVTYVTAVSVIMKSDYYRSDVA